jgi:hypothetical protein
LDDYVAADHTLWAIDRFVDIDGFRRSKPVSLQACDV